MMDADDIEGTGSGEGDGSYFKGKLLLAMPNLGDPRFYKSVIFMVAHDNNGAMGLVINKAIPGIDINDLLGQLDMVMDMDKKLSEESIPVMDGGPVDTARGFILHSGDFEQEDTVSIDDNFKVTGTMEAIKSIATGNGPDQMLFMLGYAGWSPDQLDDEIKSNSWLVAEPDAEIIFGTDHGEKWDKAVRRLGVDPLMLSGETGRA
jgi:putative transcriptional regulator